MSLDAAGLAGLGAGTGAAARTAADAGHPHFDDRQFLGKRAAGREGEAYLTLHEERLSLGKRAVPAGEVEVHKTVEMQRVQETVPVTRQEVLMAEQVVAEKRVVPTEEVVIRKQAVTENQTVEDTVRRERVDVDRSGASRGDKRR